MRKGILILAVALAGCASPPVYKTQEMIIDKEVHAMTRNEVITAIKECESMKTRPIMIFGKRNISGATKDVVVDVTCGPLYYY